MSAVTATSARRHRPWAVLAGVAGLVASFAVGVPDRPVSALLRTAAGRWPAIVPL